MERKAMLGHKVRRLRRDLRLTQAQMAEQLGISPSYLNLVENNRRPVTVQFLLRLGKGFEVDLTSFAEDDEGRLVAALREASADGLFAGADLKNQDFAEVAAAAPAFGQAFLALYRAYREAQDDLEGMAERAADEAHPAARPGAFPAEEVEDFLQAENNHFPALEAAAERLWEDGGMEAGDLFGSLARNLREVEGVRVRVMPVDVMGPTIRRFDGHSSRLLLSETLAPSGRVFDAAGRIALLRHEALIGEIVERAAPRSDTARRMLRIGLANYFAGAVMMPYQRFLEAAQATRYDLDLLQARFGASFEQVCHRLTSLQRQGARGVPFFLIRIDAAGNVSKRFTAIAGFQFARFGGACPRWNVHAAFRSPGTIQTEIARMPDGAAYLSVARTVTKRIGGWQSQTRQFALALGCEAGRAEQVVYSDGLDLTNPAAATPIGINCRVCPRLDCAQRAFPPLNHRLAVDEHTRGLTSYVQIGID